MKTDVLQKLEYYTCNNSNDQNFLQYLKNKIDLEFDFNINEKEITLQILKVILTDEYDFLLYSQYTFQNIFEHVCTKLISVEESFNNFKITNLFRINLIKILEYCHTIIWSKCITIVETPIIFQNAIFSNKQHLNLFCNTMIYKKNETLVKGTPILENCIDNMEKNLCLLKTK